MNIICSFIEYLNIISITFKKEDGACFDYDFKVNPSYLKKWLYLVVLPYI